MNLVEIGPGKVRIVARAPWWSKLLGTKRVRMRVARAVDEVRPAFVEVEVVVL